MSLIMKTAVKDRRLAINPCDGINLPPVIKGQHRYLTHEQVDSLVDACAVAPADRGKRASNVWPDDYRLVVLFLAYTGARWGEMAAMRAGRIDFLRRRASIVESVTVVKGRLEWGTPKDHERRDLPLPRFLTEALAAHVAGKDRDELVFTGEKGGVLRAQVFQRAVLTRAASSIDVEGLHPHELRHTAASLAIASGANIKVVQTMLGHESATMTLDLYGHLFPDQLDELADAFDFAVAEMRAHRGPAADFCGLTAS